MTDLYEHRALDRLADFESRMFADPTPRRPSRSMHPFRPMGYQPSLDGLRAISVIAVILYHAGFGWMRGGFLGVEVFFVVSGYLITSLLVEEQDRNGGIQLKQFWLRRARRLLPALVAMLVAVGVWVALLGTAQQQSDLQRDYLPGIFYVANWGQIVAGAQYFGNFSPFRHLWSLAVEEQWYALWPLAFVWLMRTNRRRVDTGRLVLLTAAIMMALTWWLAGPQALTSDRVNLLYLSTLTRSSGLLLGAGAAFLWQPWRARRPASAGAGTVLSVAGLGSTVLLLYFFTAAHLTDRALYRWQLATVSILSLVVVTAVVHPAATQARFLFSNPRLVALGKRSYGVYLWSWPISVICGAYDGSWVRFIMAMSLTAVISEFCFMYIETPVRQGAMRQWFARRAEPQWSMRTVSVGAVAGVVVLSLVAFFAGVQHFDKAAGGADVAIDFSKLQTPPVPVNAPSAVSTPAAAVQPAAVGPRRIVVVGDSQAHALAVNLPKGIGKTLKISDGSVDGCGVYEDGTLLTARPGFSRTFADCKGWAKKWAKSATDAHADVTLVVLGAWDVFDVEVDGKRIAFNTPAADKRFVGNLTSGVAALQAAGSKVALLEVACMRPQEVKGAYVPVLPERADDVRVAHLNRLLHKVADADPVNVTFVAGPKQWCSDPAIASDLGYRWDGVHVYKPGAKLIYETIAPTLVNVPLS
jgi:peptidoglycan/LPS O-acetylase OafA/YrhL